ncbi:MAG TPA: dipeptidase PepE [Thermoanaerobaculia bacterium]|nr:dipeptidase PepE [Thermoanaerobaculia bacterium]
MASSGRRRVLLIGSSNVYGTGYLDHAETEIVRALADVSRVFFVPHALFDQRAYVAKARSRFERMGFALDAADEASDMRAAVRNAEAVFIGGGNTFRLLSALYELDLLEPIRHRVAEGMPYVGSSAGAIVAGPSLGTTKDMPIVEPPSFDALALVPFQLSPHYLDPDPTSTHMGETQEERIGQFLEEHDRTVVGLREGAILRVDGDGVTLTGVAGARIFRRGAPPLEASPPCRLDGLA